MPGIRFTSSGCALTPEPATEAELAAADSRTAVGDSAVDGGAIADQSAGNW
jgi:hypothetical protein